jgi:inner membrane protein involved in colicin E2 resistance
MREFVFAWFCLLLLFCASLGGGERAFLLVATSLAVSMSVVHFQSARRGQRTRLRLCFWYLPILGFLGGLLWSNDLRAAALFAGSSVVFASVAIVMELLGRRRARPSIASRSSPRP